MGEIEGCIWMLDNAGGQAWLVEQARQNPVAFMALVGRALPLQVKDIGASRRSAPGKGSRLLRSEPLPGRPEQIEEAVRELHLEGVVPKRIASRYESGKGSRSWVKVTRVPTPTATALIRPIAAEATRAAMLVEADATDPT